LESLLCARLRTWAEVNEKLPPEQVAYRPGKIGSEHLFSLTVLREQARVSKTPLFAAFVDIKKAFPSIDRQRILNKLSGYGVSDQFLRILTRLYSRDSFSLLLDGVESNSSFSVTAGVHEGSPLSPLLFILYVAELTTFLRHTGADQGGFRLSDGTTIFCVLYADDVLLIATSADGLQRLIDDTVNFFSLVGI
jgi:hypothetical protein